MPYSKNVEIGRVAYAVKGPAQGKLIAINDIIDYNRVLVDGPCSGVPRQAYRLNQVSLTKYKVNIQHGQRTKYVRKAWEDAKITEKWENSEWAKFNALKQRRLNLSDYERFQAFHLKRVENRAIKSAGNLLMEYKRSQRKSKKLNAEKKRAAKKRLKAKKPVPGKIGKLFGHLRIKGVFKEAAKKIAIKNAAKIALKKERDLKKSKAVAEKKTKTVVKTTKKSGAVKKPAPVKKAAPAKKAASAKKAAPAKKAATPKAKK